MSLSRTYVRTSLHFLVVVPAEGRERGPSVPHKCFYWWTYLVRRFVPNDSQTNLSVWLRLKQVTVTKKLYQKVGDSQRPSSMSGTLDLLLTLEIILRKTSLTLLKFSRIPKSSFLSVTTNFLLQDYTIDFVTVVKINIRRSIPRSPKW